MDPAPKSLGSASKNNVLDSASERMGSAPNRRSLEPTKLLPILFVAGIIAMLWVIYVMYHLLPVLEQQRNRGLVQFVVFDAAFAMLCISYARCIMTHPGSIPEDDAQWEFVAKELRSKDPVAADPKESKRSGDRRSCKWCLKYKPDRTHHCRVCQECILKMDHHCPWIYNCVGFGNHKYFFLFVMYSCMTTNLIIWTMFESLRDAMAPETPYVRMFCLLFGETLASLLCFLVTLFLCFHVWLMMKCMTTIEFCEKNAQKSSVNQSAYSRGVYGNICAVLGDNPLLWFLPCSTPSGDGLHWIREDTPLESSPASHKTYQATYVERQKTVAALNSRSPREKPGDTRSFKSTGTKETCMSSEA